MFCSGLQAIAFWVLRQDYDPTWWIPNLCLMVLPLLYGAYALFWRRSSVSSDPVTRCSSF
jgi:hypothetical protein